MINGPVRVRISLDTGLGRFQQALDENHTTAQHQSVPTPDRCPRCRGNEFVPRTPFPSEFTAKRMCRNCCWIADDRPAHLQPAWTQPEPAGANR